MYFQQSSGPGVETKYVYGLMGSRGGGASRVAFREVRVPKENLLGPLNGGTAVFNTMMIPERLGAQTPACANARVNRTPSRAKPSMCGVVAYLSP